MELTPAQREVLSNMGDGPTLRNFDESAPQWWIEGKGAVYKRTGEALVKRGFVRYAAHWGGQPGILGFSITEAGRLALSQAKDEAL